MRSKIKIKGKDGTSTSVAEFEVPSILKITTKGGKGVGKVLRIKDAESQRIHIDSTDAKEPEEPFPKVPHATDEYVLNGHTMLEDSHEPSMDPYKKKCWKGKRVKEQ